MLSASILCFQIVRKENRKDQIKYVEELWLRIKKKKELDNETFKKEMEENLELTIWHVLLTDMKYIASIIFYCWLG